MKVSAVVPVYNEEKTIGNVLNVLLASNKIDHAIVVDDGSNDNTQNILEKFKSKKLKIIKLRRNTGKGNAVRVATKNMKSDVILFIDGDLIGLKEEHLKKLLNPVINNNVSMVIGLMDKGNFIANMIMPYFPLTGGQRAILAKVFMEIRKTPLIEGWGLESVMNNYCRKKNLKFSTVKLDGVDHTGVQAKKYGLMAFLRQIYDVALIRIKLLGVKYN